MNKTAKFVREYVKQANLSKTISNIILGTPWRSPGTAQDLEMVNRLIGASAGGALGGLGGYFLGTDEDAPEWKKILMGLGGAAAGTFLGSRGAGAFDALSGKILETIGEAIENTPIISNPIISGLSLSNPTLAHRAKASTTLNNLLTLALAPINPPSAALMYAGNQIVSPIAQLAGTIPATFGSFIAR